MSKLDMLQQFALTLGINPEQVMVGDASAFPHRTYASMVERDEQHVKPLAEIIKGELKPRPAELVPHGTPDS